MTRLEEGPFSDQMVSPRRDAHALATSPSGRAASLKEGRSGSIDREAVPYDDGAFPYAGQWFAAVLTQVSLSTSTTGIEDVAMPTSAPSAVL